MEDICRLCLNVQTTQTMSKLNVELLEKINTCISVNIMDDEHLPNHLCPVCMEKVEDIYTFQKIITENQNTLISYFIKGQDDLNNFYIKIKNKIKLKGEICDIDNKENKLLNNSQITSNCKEIYNTGIKIETIDSDVENSIYYSSEDELTLSSIKKAKEGDCTVIIEKDKGDLNENFKCLMCFELLESKVDLLKHYNGHTNKETGRKSDISYSILSANGISIYKCNKCSKEYSHKKGINRHIAGHTEIRPFICKICGRTYKTVSEIVRHGRAHNGSKLYCSYQCGYSTVYMGALKAHHRRHNKSEYKYKCDKCGKGFQVKTWYEQHQNVHNGLKPFVCDLCGVAFHMDRYLTAHRSAVHPQSSRLKRYICVHCSLPCDSMKSLTDHLKEHGIVTNFLCDICGKTLANSEQMKFHKRKHLGERPFTCSTCNKSFPKKFNLQVHERTHTGERAHPCGRCGKRFTQRSTLHRHIARQHAGSDLLKCGKCQEEFASRSQLNSHRKSCA
ncbi:zinc finger protein 33B-like [Galleria mellonella]|uniref:Zinc finger protein 33B-like n=1 Tax=Galleria mellonella TaxID=7137 RepID=A0ABM3MNV2_GALME|nr:zinc finger protein 33B-like [Galleria mellonella]